MAISDNALDRLRGGFDIGGGLMVNFGITRAVYINGDLVTQTTLNFGNLTGLTTAQASQLNEQIARRTQSRSRPAPATASIRQSSGAPRRHDHPEHAEQPAHR